MEERQNEDKRLECRGNITSYGHTENSIARDSRSSLLSRLGKFSIVLAVFSFLVCLGSLAFITFLWTADTNNTVWRSIVLSGWTTRSVTIASLALRWATASQ